MPIDPSIALNPNAPKFGTALSDMLDLSIKKLALDKGRATYDADVAQRQAESGLAQTNASLGQQTLQPRVDLQNAQTQTVQQSLSAEQMKRVQDNVTSLVQDPDVVALSQEADPSKHAPLVKAVQDKLMLSAAFAAGAGVPQQVIDQGLKSFASVLQSNPQGFRQALANRQKAGIGAQAQVQQDQVPAGQQNPAIALPSGGMAVAPRDQFGRPQAPQNYPGTTAPGAAPPLVNPPPGESTQTLPEVLAIRTAANSAAAAVPGMRDNARNIIQLADEIPKGKLGGALSDIASKFGYVVGDSSAANLQRLGHYMSLQTQMAAGTMGANTDQARATTEAAAAGNGAWTPEAIKSTAKVYNAYVTGAEQYNKGLETYLDSPQNTAGQWGARQFKNAWSSNFDPVAMQMVNAKRDGDTAEYDRLKSANKGNTRLIQSLQSMSKLSQGQLP